MKILKWLLRLLILIIGLVFIIYLVGYFQPEKHTISVTQSLNLSIDKTWNVITDFENFPSWRSNLTKVELTSATSWTEVSKVGEKVKYEQIEKIDRKKLVTQIASKGLPYSGKWIFTLKSDGQGTLLTIEEQGEVYNPIFRFISKFIIGHSSSINTYMDDLQIVE